VGGQPSEWSLFGFSGLSGGQLFEIGGFGGGSPIPLPDVACLLVSGLLGAAVLRKRLLRN